jgi:hypothetical protein
MTPDSKRRRFACDTRKWHLRSEGDGVCLWTTRSVRPVVEPADVVANINRRAVLVVATSPSAFSVRNY